MGSDGKPDKPRDDKKETRREFPLWDIDVVSKSDKTAESEIKRELQKKRK